MSHVSTHVLDNGTGLPAAGIAVTLAHLTGPVVGTGATDSDGRVAGLGPDELAPGDYALTFATGDYFVGRPAFFPQVTVTFTVDGPGHLHVPLLLSAFAYSTYRGS